MDDHTGDEDIHLPFTELTIVSAPLVLTSASESSRSEAPELPLAPEAGTMSNPSPSLDDQPRSLVDHLPSHLTGLWHSGRACRST
jgi:hypothetical protein